VQYGEDLEDIYQNFDKVDGVDGRDIGKVSAQMGHMGTKKFLHIQIQGDQI
jgi:hypothetical protein